MNCKEIDLNQVVASQAKNLERLVGDGIELSVTPAPVPMTVRADEGMVGQILSGLVDNAKSALPGGGRVEIEVESVEVDDIHARIQPGARLGEFVRLSVHDNGTGFHTEQLRRMFVELPAATPARFGNGLSLPLLSGIVRRRGGWIEACSQTSGGTTVQVYLPAVTARRAGLLEPSWATETILLVDDEVAIRRMVRTVLERASYDVIEAETGAQALSLWDEHRDTVQLLLTDMVMPELTGRDLAVKLLQTKPDLKVIYTSGFDLEAAAQRDTAGGSAQFLHKPYDMRLLLETVHTSMTVNRSHDRAISVAPTFA